MCRLMTLAATLAAMALAAPSAAAIMATTYTGTLLSGYDQSGIFGAALGDLAGMSYTATFTYDTALGTGPNNGSVHSIRGGIHYSTGTPMLSATLRMNGITYTFRNDGDGEALTNINYTSHGSQKTVGQPSTYISISAHGAAATSLLTPYADRPATAMFGRFYMLAGDALTGDYSIHTTGKFGEVGSVSVTDVTPLPEPAAWALMIVGFGLVGAASRRRRAVLAA